MPLSLWDFVRLGADRWRVQTNPLVALFMRLIGPLGTHARIRNAHVIAELQTMNLGDCRIVDAGAGEGYTLFWLARHLPTALLEGVDLDPDRVDECRRTASAMGITHLSFRQGTADDLPSHPGYDAILSIDVLEHVKDDVGVLRQMATALRPGGHLVLHVPLRHQLQRRILPGFQAHVVIDHVRDEYTPDEIRAKLAQAGFTVTSLRYGFGLWGELSFELNNLFWQSRPLRNLFALCTLPLAILTGYYDTRHRLSRGNSIILVASRQPVNGEVA